MPDRLDLEGLSDISGRVAHRAGEDDEELTATHLGDKSGQGVSEMDNRLQCRFAQEHQGVGSIENVRTPPANWGSSLPHRRHIGVESGEGFCDRRPRLLVGDGLVDTGEAEQNREAAGELVDVAPDGFGVEGPPCRGEQGCETAGDEP